LRISRNTAVAGPEGRVSIVGRSDERYRYRGSRRLRNADIELFTKPSMNGGLPKTAMDIKKVSQLSRFLRYILGRHPDEFGLVPDDRGYLPVNDVLKVLHSEGWPHVRRNHLETLDFHLGKPVLEIRAHLLRARDRSQLVQRCDAAHLPKLLHVPIRRRAYEAVLQHGLRPQGHTGRVVLFADPLWAQKAGRRHDAQPVIVTVNVQAATKAGCLFQQFGERIFLTDRVPPVCCRLPRTPKTHRTREVDQTSPAPAPKTPGSFILTIEPVADQRAAKTSKAHRTRPKDWKKERRKARRWKENQNKGR